MPLISKARDRDRELRLQPALNQHRQTDHTEKRSNSLAPSRPEGSLWQHRSRRVVLGAALVAIICCSLAVVSFMRRREAYATPIIPQSIAQQALFPVYVPAWLPTNYKLEPSRYQFQNNTALLAYASDRAGNGLAISEVSQPANIDPAGAFGNQLTSAHRITGTPYLTITGILTNGEHILSISPGSTWIIFTYRVNFNETTLRDIASHLVLQK
jgi:hypothetical protein